MVRLVGEEIAGELLRLAREQGVTLTLSANSRRSQIQRLFRRSPIDTFARLGTGIDVYEIETSK